MLLGPIGPTLVCVLQFLVGIQHFLSGRKGLSATPILPLWYSNFLLVSAFIIIYASWSSMGMYWSNIMRLWTQSLRWCYWMSIFLDLSWNNGLTDSLMQLWLSQCIIIRSIWERNKPTRISLIQMASHVAWLAAMYSALAELSAIDHYFLLY